MHALNYQSRNYRKSGQWLSFIFDISKSLFSTLGLFCMFKLNDSDTGSFTQSLADRQKASVVYFLFLHDCDGLHHSESSKSGESAKVKEMQVQRLVYIKGKKNRLLNGISS